MRRSIFITFFLALSLIRGIAQTPSAPDTTWHSSDPGFRAIGITSSHTAIWICGVGERIASSSDGQHWEIKHHREGGGALLLGISFATDTFGYAYGTGGIILTTEDGGTTWTTHRFGDDSILLASLSDPNHGLFRTSQTLFYLDGSDSPHPISQPADILKRFSYTPALVALTSEKMGILLSEGAYSEAGFLTTTDGGKSWAFYDPPSTGIASFLRVDGKYWATGHEVVNKDKPGGGNSVPLAMVSEDGQHWSHTTNEIKACHWESCGICTTAGCLGSSTLLIDPFHAETAYFAIPNGDLTARWAALSDHICSIHTGVFCATLGKPSDIMAIPKVPKPTEQSLPRLGTVTHGTSGLRCLTCSLEPVYVDEKVQGQFKVHVALQIGVDGTLESVTIQNAPSDSVQQKMHAQFMDWLFEPPQRDGKPVRVSSQGDFNVMVVRSK